MQRGHRKGYGPGGLSEDAGGDWALVKLQTILTTNWAIVVNVSGWL
jgi:hypothetical protein